MGIGENSENLDDSNPEEETAFDSTDFEVTEVPEFIKQQPQDSKFVPKLRKFEIDESEDIESRLSKAEFLKVWKRFDPNKEKRRRRVLYWILWLYTVSVITGLIVFAITKNVEVLVILIPGILVLLRRALDWL